MRTVPRRWVSQARGVHCKMFKISQTLAIIFAVYHLESKKMERSEFLHVQVGTVDVLTRCL